MTESSDCRGERCANRFQRLRGIRRVAGIECPADLVQRVRARAGSLSLRMHVDVGLLQFGYRLRDLILDGLKTLGSSLQLLVCRRKQALQFGDASRIPVA